MSAYKDKSDWEILQMFEPLVPDSLKGKAQRISREKTNFLIAVHFFSGCNTVDECIKHFHYNKEKMEKASDIKLPKAPKKTTEVKPITPEQLKELIRETCKHMTDEELIQLLRQ